MSDKFYFPNVLHIYMERVRKRPKVWNKDYVKHKINQLLYEKIFFELFVQFNKQQMNELDKISTIK